MPKYSKRSLKRLETCDERLQRLFNEVIKYVDCTIIEGHRREATQNSMFETGRSKLRWPDSKHNTSPSKAVDVAPYFPGVKIPWDDRRSFDYFAGVVKGLALSMDIPIRWGGDWNQNGRPGDVSRFHDLPHFEIIDP